MRWILIAGLLFATASAAQNTLTVTVVLNEPEAGGVLRIALCPDKQSYDKEVGCTLLTVPAEGHVVTATFNNVKAGVCAVKVFHDVNNNGELDTSWIGWPQEPIGFSNDAPVNQGQPPFKLAAITLKEGANTSRIALR